MKKTFIALALIMIISGFMLSGCSNTATQDTPKLTDTSTSTQETKQDAKEPTTIMYHIPNGNELYFSEAQAEEIGMTLEGKNPTYPSTTVSPISVIGEKEYPEQYQTLVSFEYDYRHSITATWYITDSKEDAENLISAEYGNIGDLKEYYSSKLENYGCNTGDNCMAAWLYCKDDSKDKGSEYCKDDRTDTLRVFNVGHIVVALDFNSILERSTQDKVTGMAYENINKTISQIPARPRTFKNGFV